MKVGSSHHVLICYKQITGLAHIVQWGLTQGHEFQVVVISGGHLRICLPQILRECPSTPGRQQRKKACRGIQPNHDSNDYVCQVFTPFQGLEKIFYMYYLLDPVEAL